MNRHGFSLLELSIVLTILAVVVAGGLTLGTAKVQQDELRETYQEMQDIQTALKVFLNENGRLPCPASINLARNNALFGREATDCADASPPSGLVRVEYPAASGEYVRIGGVPFYALEMPDKYLEDAWQGRYLYAVHEDAITALTSTSTGTITVNDDNGTSISDAVVAAIVSHGPNHKGAYSAKAGTLFATCDATNKDKENCDADGVFTDAVYNDGSTAANFYDDLIVWNTRMTMFETLNVSGAFKPWDFGAGKSSSNYPLQIKGLSATDFGAGMTFSVMNAACNSTYPGSWMLRASDLQYVDDIPVLASAGRIHIDECISYDTTPTPAIPGCWIAPGIRLTQSTALSNYDTSTYVHNDLSPMNCDNWGTPVATSSTSFLVARTAAAVNFRDADYTGANTNSFTAQTHTDAAAGITISTAGCASMAKLICVGER